MTASDAGVPSNTTGTAEAATAGVPGGVVAVGEVLTWEDILEQCSRLHTTRRRPLGPWEGAPLREDSHLLHAQANGEAIAIVPTRMHEPGFYVRSDVADTIMRSDDDLAEFRRWVDQGRVTRRG